jgi:hypothetical protein
VIDKKQLLKDAVQAEKDRPLPSVGRETVGIVRAVRDLLPTIRELRASGVRWAAIAEALNAQGIYPLRDGEPVALTANRLTAVVSVLERQQALKAKRTTARKARPGLVSSEPAKASTSSVALSPELQPRANSSGDTPAIHESEEDIRRRFLTDVQPFLKD